jgi:hypothetical protein
MSRMDRACGCTFPFVARQLFRFLSTQFPCAGTAWYDLEELLLVHYGLIFGLLEDHQ